MNSLDGKIAFVTGGGSGIGRATALAFAGRGAKLVVGLARCLAQDCGEGGIRANVVCPTGMNTPMMARTPAENVASYAAMTMFSRFAEPEEVANAILFLASDEASYITAAVLMVDGGATAIQPSDRQLREGAARYLRRAGGEWA